MISVASDAARTPLCQRGKYVRSVKNFTAIDRADRGETSGLGISGGWDMGCERLPQILPRFARGSRRRKLQHRHGCIEKMPDAIDNAGIVDRLVIGGIIEPNVRFGHAGGVVQRDAALERDHRIAAAVDEENRPRSNVANQVRRSEMP